MNTEEEYRNGYLVTSQMKKVWNVQIQLLKKLLEVCNKYNLRIWADSGTLLGTIREHGYIPWDDDIDMGMFREDYDKLLEVAPLEFNAPYCMQSALWTPRFSRGHAQLRMDDTAGILPFDIFQDFHLGIFIDIFVYDAVPDNESEFILLQKKAEKMKRCIKAYCYPMPMLSGIRRPIRFWRNLCGRLFVWRHSFKKTFQEYDHLFKTYHIADNNRVAYMMHRFQPEKFLDKKLFEETIYMPFENVMMPVPGGYDNILKAEYGNYMEPRKAPTTHGGYLVLDAEHSYKDYIPQLRRQHRHDKKVKIISRIKGLFH